MNLQFSIVIICKNEADTIPQTINSIQLLSDDIVVYDSGSTDATLELLKKMPVRLYQGDWYGFGKTRQKAVDLARHDWVLVIDADEVVTSELAEELATINPAQENIAYQVRLKNHLGGHPILWGVWGHDYRVRLYPKNRMQWNEQMVHEKLQLPKSISLIKLKNPILHYTADSTAELSAKMHQYAALTAEEYYKKGKKAGWVKRITSPLFAFMKSYLLKLGFLDGNYGLKVATALAHYTFLKYRRLQELTNSK